MRIFKELDPVVLNQDLIVDSTFLKKGLEGTIVIYFNMFECDVEFIGINDTFTVFTMYLDFRNLQL